MPFLKFNFSSTRCTSRNIALNMKITGERSQLWADSRNSPSQPEYSVHLKPSWEKKNQFYLLSCRSQKLPLTDLSRIGFWIVHRITWRAGSETDWNQGDWTVVKCIETYYRKKKNGSLMKHDVLLLRPGWYWAHTDPTVIASGWFKPHWKIWNAGPG